VSRILRFSNPGFDGDAGYIRELSFLRIFWGLFEVYQRREGSLYISGRVHRLGGNGRLSCPLWVISHYCASSFFLYTYSSVMNVPYVQDGRGLVPVPVLYSTTVL
jgi:hypothetical protein